MARLRGEIVRELSVRVFECNVIRVHSELDVEDSVATRCFLEAEGAEVVLLAGRYVSEIATNNGAPSDFSLCNLEIASNAIASSYATGVGHVSRLSNSCIDPRGCLPPIRKQDPRSDPLEVTKRPYALAKIAKIEICLACYGQYDTRYLSETLTNLFGRRDIYDLESSQVPPVLIRKRLEAWQAAASNSYSWRALRGGASSASRRPCPRPGVSGRARRAALGRACPCVKLPVDQCEYGPRPHDPRARGHDRQCVGAPQRVDT